MGGPAMDCLANPLGAVRLLFGKTASQITDPCQLSSSDWGVRLFFEDFANRPGAMAKIPEINSTPLDTIPANSLVRFRGMVQDMFNPEYYMGVYKEPGGEWQTTKYTDVANSLIDTCRDKQIWERHLLYCVPVPGESGWCKAAFEGRSSGDCGLPGPPAYGNDSEMQDQREKREREEAPEARNGCEDVPQMNGRDAKRQQTENGSSTSEQRAGNGALTNNMVLNMPLGESKLVSCLVKVYDNVDADLKLNDVVEFIGILAFDPEVTGAVSSRNGGRGRGSGEGAGNGLINGYEDDHIAVMDGEGMLVDDDDIALHLPYSKVPRLHCICKRFVPSSNPLLPPPGSDLEVSDMAKLGNDAPLMRSSLLERLSKVVGGDHLAAEYLLLHMLSRVHSRREPMPLGKLSMNLLGCPAASEGGTGESKVGLADGTVTPTLAQTTSHAMSLLLPKSHLISLTLEELNGRNFVPWKDYIKNRLSTGILQLSEGTHLTIDETLLKAGRLTEVGIANVHSLKTLMQLQQVEYDFKYHTMNMQADVQMLVLSQGKSLLPADVILPLRSTAPAQFAFLEDDAETLPGWRHFIGLSRRLEHTMDAAVTKVIEDDLIASRKEDPSVGTDNFHRWLTMARLLSISYGEKTLRIERWQRVREMERIRTERLRCM